MADRYSRFGLHGLQQRQQSNALPAGRKGAYQRQFLVPGGPTGFKPAAAGPIGPDADFQVVFRSRGHELADLVVRKRKAYLRCEIGLGETEEVECLAVRT